MPLANNALVLVTDGRKTLFFRNHGDVNQIDLRTEAHDERRTRSDSEMKTDAPGTQCPSRAAMAARPMRKPISTSWRRIAGPSRPPRRSTSRALANDFEALAIIAPPKTLGELRKQLHKEAARRVVCEIPKEMTGHPIPDIEALLVSTTKAEEPAEV